jgi:hypothetical protein
MEYFLPYKVHKYCSSYHMAFGIEILITHMLQVLRIRLRKDTVIFFKV